MRFNRDYNAGTSGISRENPPGDALKDVERCIGFSGRGRLFHFDLFDDSIVCPVSLLRRNYSRRKPVVKTPLFSRSRIFLSLAAAALLTATLSPSALAERRAAEDALNLEMFAAMDAGQIEVKIIPQDATKANVIIKNLTDQPVHLQLPEAFASVPVLAQGFGGGGGIGGGGGGIGGGRAVEVNKPAAED